MLATSASMASSNLRSNLRFKPEVESEAKLRLERDGLNALTPLQKTPGWLK